MIKFQKRTISQKSYRTKNFEQNHLFLTQSNKNLNTNFPFKISLQNLNLKSERTCRCLQNFNPLRIDINMNLLRQKNDQSLIKTDLKQNTSSKFKNSKIDSIINQKNLNSGNHEMQKTRNVFDRLNEKWRKIEDDKRSNSKHDQLDLKRKFESYENE